MSTLKQLKKERQMMILATIRTLQFATRRHLMCVHNMGGIRNANRIMKDLTPFISRVTYYKEYVYYLNKEGHALLGEGKVVSRNRMEHAILRNEAWLQLYCPDDWQIETEIKYRKNGEKKRIIPDAEGILHAVEIDRSQKMKVNEEKLKNMKNSHKFINKSITGKYQSFISLQ